ncbi:MAG: hypothetical protein A2X34_04930 [Elusimicrobia bacterium GWC2_51_8]|nr:MAG: hypothetical protein A2X33_05850 [Elusimicrobia bacterium GWA2_51_34]OGR63071.1 MAG: hypothetical protein A2X34_04930 [Elusimicrobia bacterium GWC2_51_8]OGR88170.1 MAG: hypothetical protein A2021_00995 [Elusimicrobia bacterium GWF2_52_66]
MAETLGSLADKISIIQLKRYHMSEQLVRRDSDEAHRAQVNSRLKILAAQKKDLENEFTALFYAYASKKSAPKIYRQFKMYNDPKYRIVKESK